MGKITAMKPGLPKAKKTTTNLKAKKTVSLKAKDAAPPQAKKTSAAKFLALKKTDDSEFRQKVLQKRQALKKIQSEDKRGVIVLSNIPHGFFEGEMLRYFRQFGVVENVRLVRSKRTGQSCGFAYIEFQHYEVAKIVAKHMDGYLTFGKIMKCRVVPPEVVGEKLFKGKNMRPNNCPKLNIRKGAIRKLNKQRTQKQIQRRAVRLKSTYSKKLKKLQELGIDLPLQTLLNIPQQSEDAVDGQAMNGHIKPDTPLSEAENNDQASITLPDDASDVEPSSDVNADLTKEQKEELGAQREELAAQIMNHLESAKKAKTPKKAGAKTQDTAGEEKKMVLEVDESDDEVVLKTPPNAIKKYVKMGTESTPTATPKNKKKTPKSVKVALKAAKITPKLVKLTPKSVKSTPKSEKGTPKALKTPKNAKDTPKVEKTPKEVKGTPKTPKITPGGKNVTPRGKNKTPKAKTTPQVPEVRPESNTPEPECVTPKVSPKVKKKTPKTKTDATPKRLSNGEVHETKGKKLSALLTQATPKIEELSTGEIQNTPKTGKKTLKNKKETPDTKNVSMEDLQDTPGTKRKTPKVKKMGVVNENGVPLSEASTPKKKSAAASPKGKKLSPKATKLTPKVKKMTPKASPQTVGKREVTQPTSTPSKDVALTPQATPGKKKGKASQTLTQTPKVTPGKRKQSEDVTPVVTPNKKKISKKTTPSKASSPTTPKKIATPKAMSGKKTPKMTPGKRKSALELIPDGKSHTKKQKLPVAS